MKYYQRCIGILSVFAFSVSGHAHAEQTYGSTQECRAMAVVECPSVKLTITPSCYWSYWNGGYEMSCHLTRDAAGSENRCPEAPKCRVTSSLKCTTSGSEDFNPSLLLDGKSKVFKDRGECLTEAQLACDQSQMLLEFKIPVAKVCSYRPLEPSMSEPAPQPQPEPPFRIEDLI